MSVQVKDTPLPARATARSLKALRDRCGPGREGAERFELVVTEGVRDRQIDVSGVDLEEVAHLAIGPRWRQHLGAGVSLRADVARVHALESGQPLTTDLFNVATGQLAFSEVRRNFELEGFVLSALIPVLQSSILGAEIVPEVAPMGDVSEVVLEGQEYPSVGLGSNTYELPASEKRGLKIGITEEAMRHTGQLTSEIMRQSQAVGLYLGLRREIKNIDNVLGALMQYVRNGTGTAAFLTSGAYVNKQTGVPLVDYRDIETAELLLGEQLNPDTGLPIMAPTAQHLVVMPFKKWTAQRILNATVVRSGDITTGAGVQMEGASPLSGSNVKIVSSQLIYRRALALLDADPVKTRDLWLYGSLTAFGWKELWPLEVKQRSGESPLAFERDIVLEWKARYHGTPYVRDPRLITRNENTALAA